MTTLAAMLLPMVDEADPMVRGGLEQMLEELRDVQADVIGFEAANKSLPEIRRRAEHHTPSLLTKGGRAHPSENSTLVISVGQLVGLIGRMIEAIQKDAHDRRPADAILKEMVAIKGKGRSIDIGLGVHEETLGGHIRF